MTDKQCKKELLSAKAAIIDIKITLEYAIKLLEGYRCDLKSEIKELNRSIKEGKNKLKSLNEKI